jgi:integral membrane protein
LFFVDNGIKKFMLMSLALLSSSLGRFRLVAFVEGCSYLLLGVTMVLKYHYGMPKPNYVVGMAHGVLFILYVSLLAQVGFQYKWSRWKMMAAFVASLLPFGTFYADVKLFRE